MMRNVWKLGRIAICTAAIVGVSATVASAAPARLASNTNLRMGPGTNFGIITTVPGGTVVNVIRCRLLWCNVIWRGRPGYMIARNLSAPPPRRVVAVAPPPPVVVVGPPAYGPYPYYYGPGPYYGPGRFFGPRVYFGPRRWGWRRW
jgi:uncharacterized protein YraI